MTTPIHSAPLDLVTTAILGLLTGTGRTIYDAVYDGNPTRPPYPYGILYRLLGGSSDPFPDLGGDPQEDTLAYQVTAVSNLRNQCEATGRLFRDRILARDGTGWVYGLILPTGWVCIDRRPDPAMPGIDRAGDGAAAVYSLPLRFTVTIAPA